MVHNIEHQITPTMNSNNIDKELSHFLVTISMAGVKDKQQANKPTVAVERLREAEGKLTKCAVM